MALQISNGHVDVIRSIVNPDKLTHLQGTSRPLS
jgi:hypothetical protein